MESMMLASSYGGLKPVSIMNFMREKGHHLNKELYIWKVFESIYERKKKWMKKSALF
jgi:hypothetical protein